MGKYFGRVMRCDVINQTVGHKDYLWLVIIYSRLFPHMPFATALFTDHLLYLLPVYLCLFIVSFPFNLLLCTIVSVSLVVICKCISWNFCVTQG